MEQVAGKSVRPNERHAPYVSRTGIDALVDRPRRFILGRRCGIDEENCGDTNHTVMPEALEKWPLDLMEELLPRHMEIIRQIDSRFISEVKATFKGKRRLRKK